MAILYLHTQMPSALSRGITRACDRGRSVYIACVSEMRNEISVSSLQLHPLSMWWPNNRKGWRMTVKGLVMQIRHHRSESERNLMEASRLGDKLTSVKHGPSYRDQPLLASYYNEAYRTPHLWQFRPPAHLSCEACAHAYTVMRVGKIQSWLSRLRSEEFH